MDAHPTESERRTATVMFADISGFTAMSERIDPEEVTAVVNECFSLMGKVIERHGGTIDKFMGDCIMVLFGVPKAMEDAPKRAVECALEMRGVLKEFSQRKELDFPLDIHIGINSGELIYGEIGSEQKKQHTVMGDTVNVASRLEDASEKGQIVVGALTHRATSMEFEYRELRPVVVRGKSEPIPVFELIEAKHRDREQEAALERMIHSDMIGRVSELGNLKGLVEKVIGGEGAIVSIVGDAGIGKSRLVRELRGSEIIKRVTILEGRTQSLGQSLSFHLLADMIRHWAGIFEEDKDEDASRKLNLLVNEYNPREFGEIYPFLCVLLGVDSAGQYAERMRGIEAEGLSKLILKSLRSLLIGAALKTPLVIRLEDLHWSDQSSIELLLPLLRLALSHRILYILVLRPRYAETSDRILSYLRENFAATGSIISLEPLNEAESKTLVGNLLKNRELPPRILGQIVDKSEGNPFFIEEVVRSLIDEGAVEVRRNRFMITAKIDTVVIPDTINQVILTRIDRLEEETRNLLKIASVIGRAFLYRILAQVAPALSDLEVRMEILKRAEILLERRSREEREYLFRQALAHEAVYNSILIQKRKELHLNVAKTIEGLFSSRLPEFYGMLAYHYSQAEDLDKAEEYLIKAGELALQSSASSEALNFYNRALSLYLRKSGQKADPQKLSVLAQNIAQAYSNKGYYAEAVNYFDRALEYLGERAAPAGLLGLVKAGTAILAVVRTLRQGAGRKGAAASQRDNLILNLNFRRGWALSVVDPRRFFFDSMIALKRLTRFELGSVENGVSILAGACALFIFSGMLFALARRILEHIKGSIRSENVKEALLHAYYEVLLGLFTGVWDHRLEEGLLEANLRTGDLQTVNFYLLALGLIAIERGAFSEAHLIIDRLHRIGESYLNEGAVNVYHELSAKLFLKAGRPAEALTAVKECILMSQKAGTRPVLVYFLGIEAAAEMIKGEQDAAKQTLDRAQELIGQVGTLVPHHLIRYAISWACFDLWQLERAMSRPDRRAAGKLIRSARRSVALAVRLSARVACDRTEAYRLQGTLFWLLGRQEEALHWFARSLQTGEQLQAKVELARTYREIEHRLAAEESRHKELEGLTANRYRELASSLFQELGLR